MIGDRDNRSEDMNQLEFLQIELKKTQEMMGIYHQLPQRKQKKRKYLDNYYRLIRREIWLKAQIVQIK